VFWTGPALSRSRQALLKWGLAAALGAGLVAGGAVQAKAPPAAAAGSVALADLPAEAQTTHRLILAGGPFPFRKDGIVFGNREGRLQSQPRGYYHEYTVPTPGARDRGARRIVCGGQPKTQPKACFYTDDHYASFRRIQPATAP
jgi:ribonuclease T1